MRALNTTTLTFESPPTTQGGTKFLSTTPYAILSHRWAIDNDHEVLYDDIKSGIAQRKPGFAKLHGATQKAKDKGLDWIWIDTCCIDKRSSAELTEAINSMYGYYWNATCCFAYLQDIAPGEGEEFYRGEWFERGWCLQELLAPLVLEFYDRDWNYLGTKDEQATKISGYIGINERALKNRDFLQTYSVAQRMSWAARRTTSRPEDTAYSLLEIFDVNMVPMYGEGHKAFIRLQEEIIKHNDDHSIFAWSMDSQQTQKLSGLLAPGPDCFRGCSKIVSSCPVGGHEPFTVTNRGLSMNIELTPWTMDTYLARIDCSIRRDMTDHGCTYRRIAIFLRRLEQDDQYARINLYGNDGLFVDEHDHWDSSQLECARPMRMHQVFVRDSFYSHFPPLSEPPGEPVTRFILPQHLLEGCGDHRERTTVWLPEPWKLKVLPLQTGMQFKQIGLGLDFDSNPVCILTDATSGKELCAIPPIFIDDGTIHGREYLEVDFGRKTLDRECHDGIWRLKGNRRLRFEVLLLDSKGVGGSQVVLGRFDAYTLILKIV